MGSAYQEQLLDVTVGDYKGDKFQGNHSLLWDSVSRRKQNRYQLVGLFTGLYCLVEIVVAIKTDSLALLSDGFHNLGDVIAVWIAWWVESNKYSRPGKEYTYGFRRVEVLGGMANGWSLIALCLYIVLESIPDLIEGKVVNASNTFIIVAAIGLFINTVGSYLFSDVHVHGIGAHGHSHAHSHDEECNGHGHDHDHAREHGHGHAHAHDEHEHGHGHAHSHDEHEHAHGHGHGHHNSKSHQDEERGHSSPQKSQRKRDASSSPGPFHKGGNVLAAHEEAPEASSSLSYQDHEATTDAHGRGHDGHDHAFRHAGSQEKDLNMNAVFVHYLGDSLSSLLVLIEGIILVSVDKEKTWINYIDPLFSWLIVAIIVRTTIPILKECSMLVLQLPPSTIDMTALEDQLKRVKGVKGLHDFHIWTVIPGLTVASLHYLSDGIGTQKSIAHIKEILHRHGVHSSTIQAELISSTELHERDSRSICSENCVPNCQETWCCQDKEDVV